MFEVYLIYLKIKLVKTFDGVCALVDKQFLMEDYSAGLNHYCWQVLYMY